MQAADKSFGSISSKLTSKIIKKLRKNSLNFPKNH